MENQFLVIECLGWFCINWERRAAFKKSSNRRSDRLALLSLVRTFNTLFNPEARAHRADGCGCCRSSWEGWVLAGPSKHRLLPRAGTSATESGPTCTSFTRTVPPRSGSTRMIFRSRDHRVGGAQYSGRYVKSVCVSQETEKLLDITVSSPVATEGWRVWSSLCGDTRCSNLRKGEYKSWAEESP